MHFGYIKLKHFQHFLNFSYLLYNPACEPAILFSTQCLWEGSAILSESLQYCCEPWSSCGLQPQVNIHVFSKNTANLQSTAKLIHFGRFQLNHF